MTTATELAALRASFEAFLKTYDAATSEAATERKEMMTAFGKLTASQDQLSRDMSEVKPVTDMVTSFRAKATGALLVLGLFGAIIWSGVQFFRQQIINFLSGAS